MKKYLLVIFLVAILLTLAGCREEPPTTTLMVYMVGSDLESKSGAGTQDLQEMANSGVDLSHVNVLVYAGGSPTWHNDLLQPEEHALLWLTEEGFTPITTTPAYSMGDGQCLSSFLHYGYENFPADRYALILWDHGNGPVIGYGKDMLFDNDCLTLQEMSQAMAASPFGEENKLAWVGFDACLMASAELACAWAPYADFLVASQEVEPAFGWNYQFLSYVSNSQTPQLLKQLSRQYIDACQDYLIDRGYQDRDVTLSCLDLSKTEPLEMAINALFTKASADVTDQFNQLAARRVNTRALGKATTGSDYDLVDLQDMAMWLGEMYPQESTDLINAIDDLVLTNATNAQGLCGVSLYYPFYNKVYYEKDWAAAYAQLDSFPAYGQYLESYASIWLGNEKLDSATSDEPQEQNGVYTLQLTQEQSENLASVKYYILIRDGEEYFTRIFSSSDVENRNGLLKAGFDGKVLYVTDDYGNYHIPVSIEQDRVADTGRYSVPVSLTNCCLDIPRPEDFVFENQAHRYSLNIHKDSGQVTVSALTPLGDQADALEGGKKEDSDLSKWTNAYFLHDSHRYLSRYENGAIMPVNQWTADRVITGMSYPLENGLHFTYAPLVAGEYYLLFEMSDTQGNRYCSELLPIHTDGTLPQADTTREPTVLEWQSSDPLLLTDTAGVKVWLEKTVSFGSEGYVLRAENSNDYPVIVVGSDVYRDQLLCRDNFGFLEVPAGESAVYDYGMDLGAISDLGLDRDISAFTFNLTIRHGITYAAKTYKTPFTVKLSDATRLAPSETSIVFSGFQKSAYGFLAQKQQLLEDSQLRIELLGLGGNGMDGAIRGALHVENLSDTPAVLDLEGMCLDSFYCPIYTPNTTVPGKTEIYILFTAEGYNLQPAQLTGVAEVRLLLRRYEYNPLFSGNSLSVTSWHKVKPAEASEPSALPQGTVVYEQDGLQITLLSSNVEYGYRSNWVLSVTNTSDRDIALRPLDAASGGVDCSRFVSVKDGGIPAGTTVICTVSHGNYETKQPAPGITFRLRILDFKEEAILFETQQAISLAAALDS